MAEIVTIPCLADNYAYLLHDETSGRTALIDAPEAGPILEELSRRGWRLSDILITHHHGDHIDGVAQLVEATGAEVWGAAADADRLPPLDHALASGDDVKVGNLTGAVLDVSGHTRGHIAFYFADAKAAFTADSLMAGGCGRLFEGTPAMMYTSLAGLRAMPPDTLIYSGHEYTASNLRFALTIEPENQSLKDRVARVEAARAAGEPTVPSTLQEEIDTNPFLRAHLPEVKTAIGMKDTDDVDVFAEIRARKDRF